MSETAASSHPSPREGTGFTQDDDASFSGDIAFHEILFMHCQPVAWSKISKAMDSGKSEVSVVAFQGRQQLPLLAIAAHSALLV